MIHILENSFLKQHYQFLWNPVMNLKVIKNSELSFPSEWMSATFQCLFLNFMELQYFKMNIISCPLGVLPKLPPDTFYSWLQAPMVWVCGLWHDVCVTAMHFFLSVPISHQSLLSFYLHFPSGHSLPLTIGLGGTVINTVTCQHSGNMVIPGILTCHPWCVYVTLVKYNLF